MRTLCLLLLSVVPPSAQAQHSGDAFHHWPVDLRINGKIIVGDRVQNALDIGDVLSNEDLNGNVAVLVDNDIESDVIRNCWGSELTKPRP